MDLSLLQPEDFTSGSKHFPVVLNSSSGRKYLLRRKMKITCQIHIASDLTRWKKQQIWVGRSACQNVSAEVLTVTEVKCQLSIPLLVNLLNDSIDGVWNRRQ